MFPTLLQQRVQRYDKEPAEHPEQQQQTERRQQRLLHRKGYHRDTDQNPGRHTARHRLQGHQLRRRPGTQHNPHRHHRIKIGGHGVAGNAQRHRHPDHQQEAQGHASAPEQAGAHQRKAGFAVAPQRPAGAEEAVRHWLKTPRLPRTRCRQPGYPQVSHYRPAVDQRADDQRRQHVPVGEDPAGHGAQQDRRDGRGLHQSVSLH